MSLLTAEMTDARYDPYRLLTDQNGVVFQKAVCTYMKRILHMRWQSPSTIIMKQ